MSEPPNLGHFRGVIAQRAAKKTWLLWRIRRSKPAKCIKCKSAEGELRACSFCKSGIYHNTAECLGEERGPETSLTYKSFPWCCPKCFKKGKAVLDKTLLAPAHPQGQAKRKHR